MSAVTEERPFVAEEFTVIHLATGPDGNGMTHARMWEIPFAEKERWVAMFTEAYGEPSAASLYDGEEFILIDEADPQPQEGDTPVDR